jgi:hypothetical protein
MQSCYVQIEKFSLLVQGVPVPKNPQTIGINACALFEFEGLLNLNAKMRKKRLKPNLHEQILWPFLFVT